MPKMVPTQSSNVSAMGYDEDRQSLVVQFGDTYYEFDGVDMVTAGRIIFADSIGSKFHELIRDKNIPNRKIDARTASA